MLAGGVRVDVVPAGRVVHPTHTHTHTEYFYLFFLSTIRVFYNAPGRGADRARDLAPLKLPTHQLRTLYVSFDKAFRSGGEVSQKIFSQWLELYKLSTVVTKLSVGVTMKNLKGEKWEVTKTDRRKNDMPVTLECVANRARKTEFRCCWTTGAAEFLAEFAEGLWS